MPTVTELYWEEQNVVLPLHDEWSKLAGLKHRGGKVTDAQVEEAAREYREARDALKEKRAALIEQTQTETLSSVELFDVPEDTVFEVESPGD